MKTPSKLTFKQLITLFIYLAIGSIIGSMIGKAFFHPWSVLQLPMPGDYSEYERVKMAYSHYQEKYGKKPHDLSFLPQDMINDIGKPGYPITYDAKTGKISYSNDSSPYYSDKRNLIDCIFGMNDPETIENRIYIKPTVSTPSNPETPVPPEK